MLSLYNGGAEKSLVNFLNELPRDKYQIDLLLFKRNGMFMKQVPDFVNILQTPQGLNKMFVPVRKSGKYMITRIYNTLKTRLVEKESKRRRAHRWNNCFTKHIEKLEGFYDVAIGYTSNEVLYYLNEKVSAKRKIVWVHNDYIGAGHSAEYDYPHLINIDDIVTISEKCKNILDEVFPDLKGRTHNIPNITSSAVVRNRADEFIPEEYDVKNFNILSIGRLDEQKGFDMAIEAASIMKKRGLNFKWCVIGSGVLEKTLKKQIKEFGVEDVFYLIGTRNNPYPYIKNCDILVQSSRFEGKSVVLDETKILAKPIVATDYATVRDQIEDNKEGIIVPMTPVGIADGIEDLYKNKDKQEFIHNYLISNEYGNQYEIVKYMELIDK